MKLLYIAFADISDSASGVVRKIYDHCTAFRERGLDVTLAARRGADAVAGDEVIGHFSPRTKHSALLSVINKRNQLKALTEYVRNNRFDCCYIRYDLASKGFINLLKELKCKILLEIPTYPYKKEYGLWLPYLPKLAADLLWRGKIKNYVNRIVTFYPAKEIFGVPVTAVPNGLDFSRYKVAEREIPPGGLHVLAASSMRKWHGYERFIAGMGEYYKRGGTEEITLHL
ncbi:MAG: hypothetical protein ACI4SS_03080, partial [Clostridia bacterium]